MLGAVWSVLSHIPADPDPPYKVSVGDDHGNEPVAFYVAGDHYSVVLGVSYDFGPEDVASLVFGSPSADPADVDPARLGAPGSRIRGASGGKWGEAQSRPRGKPLVGTASLSLTAQCITLHADGPRALSWSSGPRSA